MSQSERDPYSYPTRQRMDLYSLVSNPSPSSTIKRSKEGIRMKEMLNRDGRDTMTCMSNYNAYDHANPEIRASESSSSSSEEHSFSFISKTSSSKGYRSPNFESNRYKSGYSRHHYVGVGGHTPTIDQSTSANIQKPFLRDENLAERLYPGEDEILAVRGELLLEEFNYAKNHDRKAKKPPKEKHRTARNRQSDSCVSYKGEGASLHKTIPSTATVKSAPNSLDMRDSFSNRGSKRKISDKQHARDTGFLLEEESVYDDDYALQRQTVPIRGESYKQKEDDYYEDYNLSVSKPLGDSSCHHVSTKVSSESTRSSAESLKFVTPEGSGVDPESSESDSLGSKTRRATLQRILNDQGLGHVAKRLGPNNNNLADAKKENNYNGDDLTERKNRILKRVKEMLLADSNASTAQKDPSLEACDSNSASTAVGTKKRKSIGVRDSNTSEYYCHLSQASVTPPPPPPPPPAAASNSNFKYNSNSIRNREWKSLDSEADTLPASPLANKFHSTMTSRAASSASVTKDERLRKYVIPPALPTLLGSISGHSSRNESADWRIKQAHSLYQNVLSEATPLMKSVLMTSKWEVISYLSGVPLLQHEEFDAEMPKWYTAVRDLLPLTKSKEDTAVRGARDQERSEL